MQLRNGWGVEDQMILNYLEGAILHSKNNWTLWTCKVFPVEISMDFIAIYIGVFWAAARSSNLVKYISKGLAINLKTTSYSTTLHHDITSRCIMLLSHVRLIHEYSKYKHSIYVICNYNCVHTNRKKQKHIFSIWWFLFHSHTLLSATFFPIPSQ